MRPFVKRATEDAVLGPSAAGDLDAVYFKIAKRIIPFLVLLFLMAWLDRYNLGFAKLQMVKDLGFSEAIYGYGAGIVYLGYMLFEVPSNLLLERIGARKTVARITILWGITSIAMMFVKTAKWFYILRFLLGSFEAGLFPGAVLYLTILVSGPAPRSYAGPFYRVRADLSDPGQPHLRETIYHPAALHGDQKRMTVFRSGLRMTVYKEDS